MRSIDFSNGGVDNCYDTVIVLSGLINDLRLQTTADRLQSSKDSKIPLLSYLLRDVSQRGRRFQNQGRTSRSWFYFYLS